MGLNAPDSSTAESYLKSLLVATVAAGASDLHLLDGRAPTVRVHGRIMPLEMFPPLASEGLAVLLEALVVDKAGLARFHDELELDFRHDVPGLAQFRGNAAMRQCTVGP